MNRIHDSLDLLSSQGFRTLVLCTRLLSDSVYSEWKAAYTEAERAIEGREEKIEAAFKLIEKDYDLIGCTGVEDKLQDQCGETIEFFIDCGIRIWILTGDKVDTAVNVAFTCRLLKRDNETLFLTREQLKEFEEANKGILEDKVSTHNPAASDSSEKEKKSQEKDGEKDGKQKIKPSERRTMEAMEMMLKEMIARHFAGRRDAKQKAKEKVKAKEMNRKRRKGDKEKTIEMERLGEEEEVGDNEDELEGGKRRSRKEASEKEHSGCALIIDGFCLNVVLSSEKLIDLFFQLADVCHGVVCCRIAPMQKALVVRMVKSKKKSVTLAVGDGANDVSMIQEANVGVGIRGLEGLHASQNADYSISEFRFLRRLMTVHGHHCAYRLSTIIKYSLYKNIVFTTILFLFQIFCGFSLQICYNDWFGTFYNLVFTSLPILFVAILDKDLPDWVLEKDTKMYAEERRVKELSLPRLLFWGFMGIAHGCIIFFLTYLFFQEGDITYGAKASGLPVFDTYLATACLTTVALVEGWTTHFWHVLTHIVNYCSYLLYYLAMIIINVWRWLAPDYYFSFFHSFASGTYWLSMIAICTVTFVPLLLGSFIRREFFPTHRDKLAKKINKGWKFMHFPPSQKNLHSA